MPSWCRVLAFLALASCARAEGGSEPPSADEPVVWAGIRDADLWVRGTGSAATVIVEWEAVWEAEGFRERLYWYGPHGELLDRVEVGPDAAPGGTRLSLEAGAGDYRLVVPGPSRRRYAATVPADTRSVLEPTKLHRAVDGPGDGPLYWRAEGEAATLLLRSRRGLTRARVAFCQEDAAACQDGPVLSSVDVGAYRDRARLNLPASGVVRVSLPPRAKASLWVDDGPNLFARRPADWFVPDRPAGTVAISIGEPAGPMPVIGTYLEFFVPGAARSALIDRLGARAAQTYIPEDTLTRRPAHDVPILKRYEQAGIERVHAVLNDTRRDSLTGDEARSADFLAGYLEARSAQGLAPSAVAFVDEPNLRYDDYDDFAAYFARQAAMIRSHPDPSVRSMGIAAPEASSFLDPPSRRDGDRYRGAAWAERLLADHWDAIDVVSWHEWNLRDLAATDRFAESIAAAEAINTRLAARIGAEPKALAITQTNLNSGRETSDYEADGFYAGLWWASVVANAANADALDALYWFKSVDEGPYPKGLMRCDAAGDCAMKPVGEVFAALQGSLLPNRLEARSDAHPVRALATTNDAGDVVLLLVNQDERAFRATLTAESGFCPRTVRTLREEGGAVGAAEAALSSGSLTLGPATVSLVFGDGRAC